MAGALSPTIHVFGECEEPDELTQPVYCWAPEALTAGVVFHPNVLQCSGSDTWVCLECGEHTGEAEA